MYNSKRTLEVFGYDLLNKKRRSKDEICAMGGKGPKDMPVIDNCPICDIERTINLNQSRKNKPCSKCFHNSVEMQEVKLAQKGKLFTEQHKRSLKENHWSKNGYESPFKGKTHSKDAKLKLKNSAIKQHKNMSNSELELHRIKSSLQKGRTIDNFKGFVTPINTLIRQSAEGKAWTYDVLAKANFTCEKCGERGGSLHAHHKNSFNLFPEQRFNVLNGACLCEKCHNEFHTLHGRGDNTEVQFNEWLIKI